ncbi:CBS domain-containing protein, partial [Candidatus Woesearchaeota archaeon]
MNKQNTHENMQGNTGTTEHNGGNMSLLHSSVKDACVQRYKTIQMEDTLAKATTLFDGETDVLFVFDDKEYKGSLTHRAIIRSGLDKENTKVKRLVQHTPTITEDTTPLECARLMVENDVMALPLFIEGKLSGVVTADSLLEHLKEDFFSKKKVRDVMSGDVIICAPQDPLSKVINIFK